MTYNEYQFDTKFSKYIECFWVLNGTIDSFIQEALVPGGRSEIIFTNSEFFWYGDNKQSTPTLYSESFLLGPRESVNFIGIKGNYNCFGIRLKIGCLSLFTNKSSHIYSNKVQLLSEVFEQPNFAINSISANNITEAVGSVEKWFDQIFTAPDSNWKIVQELINQYSICIRDDEKLLIKEQAGKHFWSYKRTERMFLKYTGFTPKSVVRLLRFRKIMEELKSSGSLTNSAYQFGFYDQSHFIKEFHHFTGFNPSSFYNNLPEIASLLYKISK